MKSYSKPTSEQVDITVPLLSSPQHEAYFFDRLKNPFWIGPLADKNIFKYPPQAEPVEGGGIRFPTWPPSRYLARMAKQAPAEVAEIFAKIETDNASIIGNMLEAALAMPVAVAVKLVPAVCRAAREGTLWIYLKDATVLCARLAEGGELDAAIMLADALFAPSFEDGQEQPSRRDEYWYKEGLKKVVPILAREKPRGFLPKLCDWLKAAVKAEKHVDSDSGSDYSYLWRPAIEEHAQNRDYDFAGVMVGFVREGFEQAIQEGHLLLTEALKIIEQYQYTVFKRIRIHLIGEFAEQEPNRACQTIMDKKLFDDHIYKHEYARLVGRRLNILSPQQRDEWFGWIDAGPDMSNFDESIRNNLGRDATDEDRRSRIEYWKFEKLHWVREHLEGKRKKFYEKMLDKSGEPELADLNIRIGPEWRGTSSPMTVEDLSDKTFEEAVNAVSSWRPEESRFTGPSIEGLSLTFGQYIATNPEDFSTQAKLLVDKPAIFIRRFIEKMSEAVKTNREIDVAAVLDLCQWVIEQPVEKRTSPEQENEILVDKDWQPTRDSISLFVKDICKAENGDKKSKYPLQQFRQALWQLIASLYHDRAESNIIHDTSKYDPRVRDYLDLGINSPRGRAVGTALEYARWVANHIKKKSNGERESVSGGFKAMPEIEEMLEWQIAPENSSFEVLAVIGSRINLIYWIDKDWLAANAERLFHLEEIEQAPSMPHGWAAWNAFLSWVRPHIEYYKLFKAQFAYAVEQAAQVQLPEGSHPQPMNYLGEHLMLLYGRGQLGLEDDKGLLRQFLANANPDIRRHAIGFVGKTLEDDGEVPDDVIKRFQGLWELYWNDKGKKDAEEKPNICLFGTWFASGKFPDQWAMEQLEQFVEVVPLPKPDDAIVERLAKIAPTDIERVIRILDQMVHGDQEGWRVYGWFKFAKEILKQAMNTDGDARKQAEKLIDYLGRRGYTELGKLLGR